MYKIYVLKDPRTNEVRYVGCSKNIEQRYKAHNNTARDLNTPKRQWIAELRELGLKPLMEILEEVDNNYLIKEKEYITKYRQLGYNLTNTGYDDNHGNQTSFKNGHNSVSIISLNLDGSFYNSYNSISEASKQTNIDESNIHSVLSKRTKTAGKLIWIYEKDYYKLTEDDIDNIVFNALDNSKIGGKQTQFKQGTKPWNTGLNIRLKPPKNIHQYTLNKTFIKTWNTAKEAAISLNGNKEAIGQCARGKSKSSCGYWWSYELLNN